jgi:hypothetical protein
MSLLSNEKTVLAATVLTIGLAAVLPTSAQTPGFVFSVKPGCTTQSVKDIGEGVRLARDEAKLTADQFLKQPPAFSEKEAVTRMLSVQACYELVVPKAVDAIKEVRDALAQQNIGQADKVVLANALFPDMVSLYLSEGYAEEAFRFYARKAEDAHYHELEERYTTLASRYNALVDAAMHPGVPPTTPQHLSCQGHTNTIDLGGMSDSWVTIDCE